MSLRKHSFFYFRIIVALSFTTHSCAGKQVYRSHPELMTRKKDIKTIGIVPFDVKVYEVDLREPVILKLRDDWSNQARENIMKALVDVLKGKNAEIKTLTLDKEEMQKKMDNLCRAVDRCIDLSTHPFPEKEKNFDYSVGSIENILNAYGVDALIFVYGRYEIASAGRIAATSARIVLAPIWVPFLVLMGLVDEGTFKSLIPETGQKSMIILLVDRSGTILWYNAILNGGGYDLRNPKSASSLVQKVLSSFPEV